MTSQLSALFSLLASLDILIACYFQWWNITFNGGMVMKRWVKAVVTLAVLLNLAALALVVSSLSRIGPCDPPMIGLM